MLGIHGILYYESCMLLHILEETVAAFFQDYILVYLCSEHAWKVETVSWEGGCFLCFVFDCAAYKGNVSLLYHKDKV